MSFVFVYFCVFILRISIGMSDRCIIINIHSILLDAWENDDRATSICYYSTPHKRGDFLKKKRNNDNDNNNIARKKERERENVFIEWCEYLTLGAIEATLVWSAKILRQKWSLNARPTVNERIRCSVLYVSRIEGFVKRRKTV